MTENELGDFDPDDGIDESSDEHRLENAEPKTQPADAPRDENDDPVIPTTDLNDSAQPYRIGDPVLDLAQGRPMVVVDAPQQDVGDWSEANDYDLQGNYANSRFGPTLSEPVVECVYVCDIRSEPSKTYTFPVSRTKLIEVHHADDGRRLADRIAAELFEDVLEAAAAVDGPPAVGRVAAVLQQAAPEVGDRISEVSESLQARQGGDDE